MANNYKESTRSGKDQQGNEEMIDGNTVVKEVSQAMPLQCLDGFLSKIPIANISPFCHKPDLSVSVLFDSCS